MFLRKKHLFLVQLEASAKLGEGRRRIKDDDDDDDDDELTARRNVQK